MSKCSARRGDSRPLGSSARGERISRNAAGLRVAAVMVGLILLIQPACLFKKHKTAAPQVTPTIVRIVFLPLNIPNENADLRWLSLAVPVMMAKVSESAPDLEPVPLWEVMPVAVEAAGASRSITAEVAAYIASRLTAKWATEGELSPAKGGVHMTVDFIPAKTTLVAFRYEKELSIDSLGGRFQEAFEQFLRYLVARPMTKGDSRSLDANSMKEIAEALDREYGWFVAADPGKFDKVVTELARTDSRLARLLFNPSLYPSMGTPASDPKASRPAAPTTASKDNAKQPQPSPQDRTQAPAPSTTATSSYVQSTAPSTPPAPVQTAPLSQPEQSNPKTPSTPPEAPSAAQPISGAAFIPPPPRSFTQKLESIAVLSGRKENPPAAKPDAARVQRAAAPSGLAPQSATAKIKAGASEKSVPPAMNKASPAPQGQNFKIQVGSSRSKEEANAIAAKLTKAGLAPGVEMADLKEKGIWYRIRLQGYESRKVAEAAGKKLLDAKLISQYWVVPQK